MARPEGGAYDAVVVGAGHNGLVCGAYLARAGLKVLVLERRERVGGALELAQTVGRLRPSVARDLALHRHGLSLIRPSVRVFAPQPDGRALTLWADPGRTAEGLREWSARDSLAYAGFDLKVRAMSSFLAHLHALTPPDLSSPSITDALGGLRLTRAFRALGGKRQMRETLRILPMAVADVVQEAFEGEALRGALASRGIGYASMGPWSAGTAMRMLADSAGNDGGAAGETTFARGGAPALGEALASSARAMGAEVRCGAPVSTVTLDGQDRAVGVALVTGEEIRARAVVAAVDPKRLLTRMVDPVVVGPTLRWRAGNIRTPGSVAHVRIRLEGVPEFTAASGPGDERLRGRILIAPSVDYLERAFDATKYGRVSDEPFLELSIPSLSDPTLFARGAHVMDVRVQFAPYDLRRGDWDAGRDGLSDLALKTLEAYAPGISSLASEVTVTTPLDLERSYLLSGGHPMHAEEGLDQFFAWRPLLGLGRYRMGIEGLYLCGAGAHPGGGITGAPGSNAARQVLADLRRAG